MADEGDQPPPVRSPEQAPSQELVISPPPTPGITVTPAEDSAAIEATMSSGGLLQASHETEDDGALPQVRSEPAQAGANASKPSDSKARERAPAESKTEEKPLVSPEDDEFSVSDAVLSRPISPEDDDDDDKHSDTSSFFFDSDSDGESRGRRTVSSRHRSPSIADHTLDQAAMDEARSKGSRSQGRPQGFLAQASEVETVKLGEAYKDAPRRIPPAFPERPRSPQFNMTTAEEKDEAAGKKNVNSPSIGTARKPAESGTLHRRTPSANPSGTLARKRFELLGEEVMKSCVNPYQPRSTWKSDTLWQYMCMQHRELAIMSDVCTRNGLTIDEQGFSKFQDERRFFRSEFDRIQAESERQRIADSQEIEELETKIRELEVEASHADATIDGLQGASKREEAMQVLLASSDNLSDEAQAALDQIEAHAQKYNEVYGVSCKALKAYRESLDVVKEQQKEMNQLRLDNSHLRQELSESAKESKKCHEDKLLQQQTIEKTNKAYSKLQTENAVLKSQVDALNKSKGTSDLEKAKLEIELKKAKDINSALEAKTLSTESSSVKDVAPPSPEPKITQLKRELKTTQDSNASLETKNLALERVLEETKEESARYRELYESAEEQRVWSFAQYATVKKPWPIVTREIMASLVVDVINSNRKHKEESSDTATAALHDHSARELDMELNNPVSDLALPEALTRDQVIVWFAGDMGVSEMFDEIRALGHNLDTTLERSILSVLIEQGLCYGNFDVFAAFAFAGVPVSRDEFISRMSTIIELLDRIGNKLLSAEVDRDIAKDQARKLELKDQQQQLKLKQQAHYLKKAQAAMDTFEKHNGSPEGAVEELIVLQTEHADLQLEFEDFGEQNEKLRNELAYYEREIVETRRETVYLSGYNSDEEDCTLVEHHDLGEQVRVLKDQNSELVAMFNKNLAGHDTSPNGTAVDSIVGPTPFESRPATQNYYAELLSLREENKRLISQWDNARIDVPDSPACPHCSVLRAQISRLKQTNRSYVEKAEAERENAVYAARNSDEAYFEEERQRHQKQVLDLQAQIEAEKQKSQMRDSDSQEQGGVPVPCQNCGYLSAEKRRLFALNQRLESQLKLSDSRVQKYTSLAEKAGLETAAARKEIEALEKDIVALKNGSPDSVTSTQPTTAGNTPVKPIRDARIEELEEELAAAKRALGGTIATQWPARWGATKIFSAPIHQQDDAWKTFDTEGNHRDLLEERQKLREQNETMQKNLDDFEAASAAWFVEHEAEISELEQAEVKGNQARIDNFQRQLAELHQLRKTNSALSREKDALVSKIGSLQDVIDYLEGKASPDCCGVVRQELQNETSAHKSTRTELEEAVARLDLVQNTGSKDDDNDSDQCRVIKEQLENTQTRLSDLLAKYTSKDQEHRKQIGVMTEDAMDLMKRLRESERRLMLAEGPTGGVSLVDPCQDVRAELESTKNKLSADTRRLNARLEHEQTQLKDLRSLFDSAEAELANLKKAGATKIDGDSSNDVQGRDEEAQKEIEQLKENLARAQESLLLNQKSMADMGQSTAQKDLLQKRITELENELRSKPVHTLTGETIQLPADDDPCKTTILELISAQTKLNELIDNYPLDTQIDKPILWESPKAVEQKEEPSFIQGLFNVFERFTLQKDASAPSLVNTPVKPTHGDEPAVEDPNDPCSSVKKQLKNVEKQIKAFEKITELKIKLRDAMDKIHERKDQWSRTKMTLKNQVEVLELETPVYLKKKLDEALEANAKQADIIECAQIVADQHKKEQRALHKKLEILIKPGQPMTDLLTENAKQKKQIFDLHDEMHKYAFQKGKEINFLGKQLSVLYGEREKWQNAGESTETTSDKPLWTPLKVKKIPLEAPAPVEVVAEPSTESGAEPPLPKITDDGWPGPPAEKQKIFDEALGKTQELYDGTVYILKPRESHMPEPEITGLFTKVQYARWRLPQPEKQSLYTRFKAFTYNEWFTPLFWVLLMIVDQIYRYLHDGQSALGFVNEYERGPHHWVLPLWVTLPALFIMYQIWLHEMMHPTSTVSGDDEDDVVESSSLPSVDNVDISKTSEVQPKNVVEGPKVNVNPTKTTLLETLNNEDPCRDVRDELVDAKFKLVDALDQLAGNKTVIDWKNDKKTPLQWRLTENTKFWECAGVPGPRLHETMTYEEYKKFGDVETPRQSNDVEDTKQASLPNANYLQQEAKSAKKSSSKYSNVGSLGHGSTASFVDPVTGDLIDLSSPESSIHFASQIGDYLSDYPDYDINGPIYDFQDAGNPFKNNLFFAPAGQAYNYPGGGSAQASGFGQAKPKTPGDSGYATGPIRRNVKKSPAKWIEYLNQRMSRALGSKSATPMSAIRYSADDPEEMTYLDFVLGPLCDPKSEEKSAIRGSQANSSTQGTPSNFNTGRPLTPLFGQGNADGTGGIFDPNTPPPALPRRYKDDYMARLRVGDVCCEVDYMKRRYFNFDNSPIPTTVKTKPCRHKNRRSTVADAFGSPSTRAVRPGQQQDSDQRSGGLGAGLKPEEIAAKAQKTTTESGISRGYWQIFGEFGQRRSGQQESDQQDSTQSQESTLERPSRFKHSDIRSVQFAPSSDDVDPCKDVRDKLAAVESELQSLQGTPDSYELRRRMNEVVNEYRALKILYDPVRLQLAATEAELDKEKKDHETSKKKLAMADPAIIKTNEEAEAQRQKDAAANKAKDDQIKTLEQRRDAQNKHHEDLRKQLDLARAERPTGSVQTQVIYKTPEGRTWTRSIIQAILATLISFYCYSWFQELPEGMSSYDVAYFELRELFEDHDVLIFTCAGLLSAVFIIYVAWKSVDEVNPYPDSDVYMNSGPDDKGDDDDKSDDSSGKNDDSKPDEKSDKSDESGKKDEPEAKDDSDKKDESKTDEESGNKDESHANDEPEQKDSSDNGNSAKKDKPEKGYKSPKGYGYKNPLSFFNGSSVSTVPEAAQILQDSAKSYAKNIKSLFITPSRVVEKVEKKIVSPWKHSEISSISYEPTPRMVAEGSGKKLESGVDVYCKDQEDVIEKLQSQIADVEKKLAVTTKQLEDAKKPSTLSYSNISSVGISSQSVKAIETKPSATYTSVSVQTDETADDIEDAKTKAAKLEAVKEKIEAAKIPSKPTYASVAAQTVSSTDGDVKANAELEFFKKELEAAKTELDSIRKDRDELADINKATKQELDAVRKDKNALWDKKDDWNEKSETDGGWEDPCKGVREELERVKGQLSDAKVEIKWLRNLKKKEEKKNTFDENWKGTGDSDDDKDDGSDDDSDGYDENNPPPGSVEMKLYVAIDNLKFRDLELEERTRQLKTCHELNKKLRTRYYDANDLYQATAAELDALKAGNNSDVAPKNMATQTTPSNSLQRSITRSAASSMSSGGVNHTECNRQISKLTQMVENMQANVDLTEAKLADALQRLRTETADGSHDKNSRSSADDRQEYVSRLLASIEDLEEEKQTIEKEKNKLEHDYEKLNKGNKKLEAAIMRGTDHELCLTGRKRQILEDDHARLEEKVAEISKESRNIERNMNSLKEELDRAKQAVEKKNQEIIRKDVDIQRFGRQAYEADQNAKKAINDFAELQLTHNEWLCRDDPNPGFSPKPLSSDPRVQLLQRIIFDIKNKHQIVVAARDDALNQLKSYHKKVAAQVEDHVDHRECKKLIRSLEENRNSLLNQIDSASVHNRSVDNKMKEWEVLAKQVEQEKDKLAREFYEKARQFESFEELQKSYAGGEAEVLHEFAREIYEQSKQADSFEELMEHFLDVPLDLAGLEAKFAVRKPRDAAKGFKDSTRKAEGFTPVKPEDLNKLSALDPEDLIEFSPGKPKVAAKKSEEDMDNTGKAEDFTPVKHEDLTKFSSLKSEELIKLALRPKVAFEQREDSPNTPNASSPAKEKDAYPTPETSEVTSQALKEMRLHLRHAEDEARRLGTDRNRLARENAALNLRLERRIDALEQGLEQTPIATAAAETAYPTPVSTNKTKNTNKTRPADIITSFDTSQVGLGLLAGGLPTGGLQTGNWMTKFDANYLINNIAAAKSHDCPKRGPITIPEPPFPPFAPLTTEGRRRAAERMINDPKLEEMLMEKRATMAAYRAARLKFDEERNDRYALKYTGLRPTLNIPVQDVVVQRQIAQRRESYAQEKRDSMISEGSFESSEGSLSSGEWDRRYNVTPTPLPRNPRGLKPRDRSRSRSF